MINRDFPVDADAIWSEWSSRMLNQSCAAELLQEAERFEESKWELDPVAAVDRARALSGKASSPTLVKAYGGYYYSPLQAILIHRFRQTLPNTEPHRTVALASLIRACAECAAAPGHTAQPFKPTQSAAKYLFEHWRRDLAQRLQLAIRQIAPAHAITPGVARVGDALHAVELLTDKDLAFVDPPYSSVQYSRFYHVLESVTRGELTSVAGHGRYPPLEERPQSDFSVPTRSYKALETLLHKLGERRVRTVVTFPLGAASNGLSGDLVAEVAERYFQVTRTVINGRFSTLGGNTIHRRARIPAYEVVLTLRPKGNFS